MPVEALLALRGGGYALELVRGARGYDLAALALRSACLDRSLSRLRGLVTELERQPAAYGAAVVTEVDVSSTELASDSVLPATRLICDAISSMEAEVSSVERTCLSAV